MPLKQGFGYYWPIVLVLLFGYLGGGFLAAGAYFSWIPGVTDPAAKLALMLFGTGVVGAALYSSKWWAIDLEQATKSPELLPVVFDAFGYAFTLLGGGVTGCALYLIVRYGTDVVSTNAAGIRPGAAVLIALVGGLTEFKVEDQLTKMLEKYAERKTASRAARAKVSH